MPALVVCKSCGWTEAKEILLSSPPPTATRNSLFGWKEAFDTDTCMHTHTSAFMPPSDLPASSCPSFPGSWSCWDTEVGENPSPLCGCETKWIKWTRSWRSLRSHRGGGRDGERSWGWRRKGRAGNSVTQVVCVACTSVLAVRKQECSCSPRDRVPVWYPLLMWQESFLQPATAVGLFKSWKILEGEVV